MTDQEPKDLIASLAVQSAKTDSQLAKTDAQLAKTNAQLARTDLKIDKMQEAIRSIGKQLGGIGENQGAVAEGFFYNSLSGKPVLGGILFDRVIKNLGAGKPGNQVEFDIVMHNGAAMAIVEVKYKVHPSVVSRLLLRCPLALAPQCGVAALAHRQSYELQPAPCTGSQ